MLAQFDGADPMANNLFRYNLSVNDGRGDYGGITVFGANSSEVAKAAVFHNNTIVVNKNVVPRTKGAVWLMTDHHDDVAFFNNAFVALNGAPLIAGDTSVAQATFAGNAYWTAGGGIVLEDRAFSSVSSWAASSGQEKIAGRFVAVTSDPKFSDTTTYQLQSASPLLSAALAAGASPWPAWVSGLGSRDLGGVALSPTSRPEIGAREFLFADFNGDGKINSADLTVWRSAFGAAGLAAYRADLDGDGDSDGGDFLTWQRLVAAGAHFEPAATTVPEPQTFAIILPALLFAVSRRASLPRPSRRAACESATTNNR
ncbi:hypothetical protein [Lacipirellula limnantheis]|uniref:hypothetical protein n=1 Tax=Lacipirellula limnantheis TaxID=2528024 RepID=UPI00119D2390|nr:hypothetical protein [Lacipirellula limnantheis]